MIKEVRLMMGCPAAGKTTAVQPYLDQGYARLNRDTLGGTMDGLLIKLEELLKTDVPGIVLDNTYVNIASRADTIALCKKYNVEINCTLLGASIEDAQVNACVRMIQKHGRLLMPEEIAKSKDPNMIPTAALFSYRKNFEQPTTAEGFKSVQIVPFIRKIDPSYQNKALLLDYDGCLRTTISGQKYPVDPNDIRILPHRSEVLKNFSEAGWKLLGISNQSGIAKGNLTLEIARKCFQRTNELLGANIEIGFCPHKVPPISCYCRKPVPGIAVAWIEKYKLNRRKTILIGDMSTDRTCAQRADVYFLDAEDFFISGAWKELLHQD